MCYGLNLYDLARVPRSILFLIIYLVPFGVLWVNAIIIYISISDEKYSISPLAILNNTSRDALSASTFTLMTQCLTPYKTYISIGQVDKMAYF